MATAESHTQLRQRQRSPLASHVLRILLLWLIVLAPRAYVASTAVAPARDTFRYLSAAQHFDRLDARDAIGTIDVHPLYPITLREVRRLCAYVTGRDGPFLWLYAGQGWSIACSLVFMAAAYSAGVGLWNAHIAWLGAAAISIVPRQVSYAADILSDNLFAALWMISFACLVWTWRRGGWLLPLIAGINAGLAYWTKVESILLPLTFIAALSATILIRRWRQPWRQWAAAGVAFSAAFGLLFAAFIGVVGRFSPRQSAQAMVGGPTRPEPVVTLEHPLTRFAGQDVTRFQPRADVPSNESSRRSPDSTVDLVSRAYVGQEGYTKPTLGQALVRLLFEICQETRGWLLALVLYAAVDRRRSKVIWPAGLLPLFAVCGCGAMLILLQLKAGYIAGRYMTPVLPLLSMFAMTGAEALVTRVVGMPQLPWEASWSPKRVYRLRYALCVSLLAAVAAVLCVPAYFKPLHRYRWGHMQAARWLADHSRADDTVFDPNYFSAFFANRTAWSPSTELPDALPVRFAVVDVSMIYRTDNLTHLAIARVNEQGRCVAAFPRQATDDVIGVYIFELPVQSQNAAERSHLR